MQLGLCMGKHGHTAQVVRKDGTNQLHPRGCFISFAIELGIEWQEAQLFLAILMGLDVAQRGRMFQGSAGHHDLVHHVPVGLQCGIREAGEVRLETGDTVNEALAVGPVGVGLMLMQATMLEKSPHKAQG